MKLNRSTAIKETLLKSWGSDADLLSHWHISAPATLEQCVARTMKDLEEVHPSFKFFHIQDGEKTVGFFGQELGNYLNLFFIYPDYRKREKVSEIWPLIKNQFPETFYTAVYKKNKPAINFYKKNGTLLETTSEHSLFEFTR